MYCGAVVLIDNVMWVTGSLRYLTGQDKTMEMVFLTYMQVNCALVFCVSAFVHNTLQRTYNLQEAKCLTYIGFWEPNTCPPDPR